MKNILKITVLLLMFTTAHAQFGNGGFGNNNGGFGNDGMGRAGMGQMPQQEPEKPKEIPAEITAKKVVDNLKTKLQLDELQVIAISNLITKSIKQQGVILKQEVSEAEKSETLKAMFETTDRKIMELLNKPQKEKYNVMIEERK